MSAQQAAGNVPVNYSNDYAPQSDDIQAKRPITETDIANITASFLSGVDALDEAETLMFYKLSKHLLERMSGGSD